LKAARLKQVEEENKKKKEEEAAKQTYLET
jgi:hypothetical protein